MTEITTTTHRFLVKLLSGIAVWSNISSCTCDRPQNSSEQNHNETSNQKLSPSERAKKVIQEKIQQNIENSDSKNQELWAENKKLFDLCKATFDSWRDAKKVQLEVGNEMVAFNQFLDAAKKWKSNDFNLADEDLKRLSSCEPGYKLPGGEFSHIW